MFNVDDDKEVARVTDIKVKGRINKRSIGSMDKIKDARYGM